MNEKELTYGETIKQPFPELEDIEWVMVEAPEWYIHESNAICCSLIPEHKYTSKSEFSGLLFDKAKAIHENSKDFKVTWKLKQTDPHADIKAEYEKALKKYDVIKVFWKMPIEGFNRFVEVPKNESITKNPDIEYKLRYYNIDWNKLLSLSYANGEFVECEFSGNKEFEGHIATSNLKAIVSVGFLEEDSEGSSVWKHCRLAKGVEIKDEWLKEIK